MIAFASLHPLISGVKRRCGASGFEEAWSSIWCLIPGQESCLEFCFSRLEECWAHLQPVGNDRADGVLAFAALILSSPNNVPLPKGLLESILSPNKSS
jgi:hypothetical protein